MPLSSTPRRKKEHVDIVLRKNVAHDEKSTGLDALDFEHCALPELDLASVDTSVVFLKKRLSLPLVITGMTGGYPGARKINERLAVVCEEEGLALGVGSQRQMMEDRSQWSTYTVARRLAPSIPLIANLGATHIRKLSDPAPVLRLIDAVQADAIAIHLNALQEALQPEGSANFTHVLKGLALLIRHAPVPVIVKETGAGISGAVARQLVRIGVRILDVSGAGGTSWSAVEAHRAHHSEHRRLAGKFRNWGIPTAECIRQVVQVKNCTIIASGGIRDGVDIAKSLALGAHVAGMARPLLQAVMRRGVKGLRTKIDHIRRELQLILFLTGCKDVNALRKQKLIRYAV